MTRWRQTKCLVFYVVSPTSSRVKIVLFYFINLFEKIILHIYMLICFAIITTFVLFSFILIFIHGYIFIPIFYIQFCGTFMRDSMISAAEVVQNNYYPIKESLINVYDQYFSENNHHINTRITGNVPIFMVKTSDTKSK